MPAALHEEHSFAAHAAGRKQNPFSGGACTTERICAFFRRGVYVEKLLAERRDAHLPWASAPERGVQAMVRPSIGRAHRIRERSRGRNSPLGILILESIKNKTIVLFL